jgi:hypothetical protein
MLNPDTVSTIYTTKDFAHPHREIDSRPGMPWPERSFLGANRRETARYWTILERLRFSRSLIRHYTPNVSPKPRSRDAVKTLKSL